MTQKRKRAVLSIETKYKILQMVKDGVSNKNIAKKYNISPTAVCNMKRKAEEITQFYESNLPSVSNSKKRLPGVRRSTELTRLLGQWYIRCKDKNIAIDKRLLYEKAVEFNRKLFGTPDFQTYPRWEERFAQRESIRKEDPSKGFRTPNTAAADISKANFNKFLQDEGYTLDNVYNADSTGLMWKVVPGKTLIGEKEESKIRSYEEQVATFLCANATGDHKLPVLIIGTVVKPACFKKFNISTLSIIYKANIKPLMNNRIFNEWFDECFLKSVKERQLKNGHREKTLLLLDNAGLHLDSGIQSTKDEFVKIMYLPYDATSLIQPMDRGIIAGFKRNYRTNLLQTVMPLPECYTKEQVLKNHSQFKMDACCRVVHDAWSNVNNVILRNAWDKLLNDESVESAEDYHMIETDIDMAHLILYKLPECGGCDRVTVLEWFEIDKKHNTDVEEDINDLLREFINESLETGGEEYTEEIIEDILDDSPEETT